MENNNFQKRLYPELTKPTEVAFVSSVSYLPRHIEKNFSWVERLKDLTQTAANPEQDSPAKVAKVAKVGRNFSDFSNPANDELESSGQGCNLHPYRINQAGHAQVIWLSPGLSPAEVVDQARRQYGSGRIADPGVAPAGGWPSLREISETNGRAKP